MAPGRGPCCNGAKLLLDPHAREIGGDATWVRADGAPITDWDAAGLSVGVHLDPAVAARLDGAGADAGDAGDALVLLFNAWCEPAGFRLPASIAHARWERVLDTAARGRERPVVAAPVRLEGRSLAVLRRCAREESGDEDPLPHPRRGDPREGDRPAEEATP